MTRRRWRRSAPRIGLFRALWPRLNQRARPSRFAFPCIANASLAQLMDGGRADVREEAWLQAQVLAGMMRERYTGFSRPLSRFVASGVLLVG